MLSNKRSWGAVASASVLGLLVFVSALPAASVIPSERPFLRASQARHVRVTEQLRPHALRRAGPSKLDGRLAAVARATQAVAPAIPPAIESSSAGLSFTPSGAVRIVIEARRPEAIGPIVERLGGRVERTSGSLVQAVVPPHSLTNLSRHPSVDAVRAPFTMVEDAIAGEEVAASLASAWHAEGFTGNGVKVAVIDGGFSGLAQRQAEGELPADVVTGDFCGGHLNDASEHGTGVAEIVHEMAPEAQLYLLCIDTEVDLAAAAQYAAGQGVTVVNHSASWFGPARGDGSGPVGDVVRAARAGGILWVNSAGNYADLHWSGTFSDLDGDRIHDWAPDGDEGNSFVWPNDEVVCGILKWDEWPAGVSDYDLGLFESGSNRLLTASAEYQDGSQPPYEELCARQTSGRDLMVYWVIAGFQVSSSPRLDLFSFSPPLQYRTAAGSIGEPGAAAAAFTVGALCWQTRQLEYYSSQGPTIDGRVKPDIAGHDSVSGATYGMTSSCPSAFAGTSAASPEVAGAAALVKEAYPSFGPDQIQQLLVESARDLGSPGVDSATGAGELRMPATPDIVAPTATALAGSGRAGETVKLRSRVADNRGDVSIVEQVTRNGRVVATVKRAGFVTATRPRVVSVAWRAPKAPGTYVHCMRATDRAGNSSEVSCAKLVLR